MPTDPARRHWPGCPGESPGGYLAYVSRLSTLFDLAASPGARQTATNAWQVALDEITHWLWGAVMEMIVARQQAGSYSQAVFIPGVLLCILSLHTAWTEDASNPTGRRYALEEVALTYAPIARALQETTEITTGTTPASLLAVDNPVSSLSRLQLKKSHLRVAILTGI